MPVSPAVGHRDFATALAVLLQVLCLVLVEADREAVAVATVTVSVELEWCTDSPRGQEEPLRKS